MRIFDGKGKKYIDEVMEDLPDNVMFNKVNTGCGMTTLVLENDVKYVIAVPFISIIENKLEHCKEYNIDICDVYSEGKEALEILNFSGNKIITTYDSLGWVTDALVKKGELKDWKLFIDESHKLIDSGLFRARAINTVLKSFPKYKSFVFGTATPIDDKYQLDLLKTIPKAQMDWGKSKEIKIQYCYYKSKINDITATIALTYLCGRNSANAHFFINSVKSICVIVQKLINNGSIAPDKVNIICAKSKRNESMISNKLGSSYKISSINSKAKKINFYTSTAFEGCDISDVNGQTYIIVDGSKDYTKIDISSTLSQIAGRIRDTIYPNAIELHYTGNIFFSGITEKEFSDTVKENLKNAQLDIDEFNLLRQDSSYRKLILKHNNNSYIIVENKQLVLNRTAWHNKMHNFSTLHKTYNIKFNQGIIDGPISNNSIDYIYTKICPITPIGFVNTKVTRSKPSFEKLVLEYENSLEILDSKVNSSKEDIFKAHISVYNVAGEEPNDLGVKPFYDGLEPIIRESYKKLGHNKIKTLRYRKSEVKKELFIASNKHDNEVKIVKLLNLKEGDWDSRKNFKEKLKKIYLDLDIESTAKATDLYQWYSIREDNRNIKGVKTKGFSIITCNIKEIKL